MSRFYTYIRNQWLLGAFDEAEMLKLVEMNRITEDERKEIMGIA